MLLFNTLLLRVKAYIINVYQLGRYIQLYWIGTKKESDLLTLQIFFLPMDNWKSYNYYSYKKIDY